MAALQLAFRALFIEHPSPSRRLKLDIDAYSGLIGIALLARQTQTSEHK
jgi:hypothetical protein